MAIDKLTKDLLAKIGKGIAHTRVLGVTDGKVTFSNLDFSQGGEIFSIENSLEINWDEPTLSELKVDQGLQTIDISIEQGELTFAANYPTLAEDALAEFFKTAKTASTIKASADVSYTGKSIFTEPKTTELSILIEDQNEAFGICLARVSVTARLALDNDSKVWYIGLNGRVLANLEDGQGDILVAPKAV